MFLRGVAGPRDIRVALVRTLLRVALIAHLAVVGIASAAQAGYFVAVDFGNPGGRTPPGTIYSITETGVGTQIGLASISRLNGMATSPSGEIIITADGPNMLVLDPSTFTTSIWAPDPDGVFGNAAAFSPSGQLYLTGVNASGGQTGPAGFGLHRYDPATGQTAFVGDIGFEPHGLDFSPNGTLYGWDTSQGLVTINLTTGVGTDVNPSVPGAYFDFATGQVFGAMGSIAFRPDGRLFGAHDKLYEIDTQVGTWTEIGGSGFEGIRGMVWVPEPGSAQLVVVGLLLWLVGRHRRR